MPTNTISRFRSLYVAKCLNALIYFWCLFFSTDPNTPYWTLSNVTSTSFKLSWSDDEGDNFTHYSLVLNESISVSGELCNNHNGNCTFPRNATRSLDVIGLQSGTLYLVEVHTLIDSLLSEPLILTTYTGIFFHYKICHCLPAFKLTLPYFTPLSLSLLFSWYNMQLVYLLQCTDWYQYNMIVIISFIQTESECDQDPMKVNSH